MNIYERLIKDHDRQRALCDKLAETEGASDTRAKLWEDLKVELDAHAAAEEQVFYAVLMKKPEGTDKARHSVHEHQEMTKLIEELSESDQGSGGWMNKFKKLQHQVTHHLDEEENEIFKTAKQLIGDDRAVAMAQEFNERKPAEVENQ